MLALQVLAQDSKFSVMSIVCENEIKKVILRQTFNLVVNSKTGIAGMDMNILKFYFSRCSLVHMYCFFKKAF